MSKLADVKSFFPKAYFFSHSGGSFSAASLFSEARWLKKLGALDSRPGA
jgi:hypothetical protein